MSPPTSPSTPDSSSQSAPQSSRELSIIPAQGRRVFGRWSLGAITGALPGAISLRLLRDDEAWVQLVITPPGAKQAFARTAHGDVYYRKFGGLSDAEAVETTRAFAELLDRGALPLARFFPHLGLGDGPGSDEEANRKKFAALVGATGMHLLLGASTEANSDGSAGGEGGAPDVNSLLPVLRRELFFDAPGIAEFFAPELAVDGPAVAGHVLRAIYLPAIGRRQNVDFTSYVLEFEAAGDDADLGATDEKAPARPMRPAGEVVRIELHLGEQQKTGFGRCGQFHVGVLNFHGDPDELPPALASLCSWVLALIHFKHAVGLRPVIPTSADQLRALSVPQNRKAPSTSEPASGSTPGSTATGNSQGPAATPPALNLAIDTECNQQCTFCSVKSYVRPVDHGDEELNNILFQLRSAREQGVREVRLNGIDPLTYSKVLEVVDAVTRAGFPRLSVYSPCRRLADPVFRHEFLRRCPEELVISIPIYGVTPSVHDAVVGTPGAHAQVMAALEGLLAEKRKKDTIRVSFVVVRQNVHEFAKVVGMARARGLMVDPHVSYPMRQTVRDPYAESAVRESEIIARFVDDVKDQPTFERSWALDVLSGALLHPCLLIAEERRTGAPVFGAREPRRGRPILTGTQYRSSDNYVHSSEGAGTAAGAFSVATVPCPKAAGCALASICPAEQYAVYKELFGLDEFQAVSVAELYAIRPHPEAAALRPGASSDQDPNHRQPGSTNQGASQAPHAGSSRRADPA